MPPTFADNLKAYNGLKIGPFRPRTHDTLDTAREFLKYIEHVESALTDLEITDAARKVKIFSLVEYDLSKAAKEGVLDGRVAAEADEWKKFKKKLSIYYQTEKLESAARRKLSNIRQKPNQLPVDLKVEILQTWKEANYGDGDQDKHILQIFLQALLDSEVRLQYQYSLMPGKTPLKIDDLIEVANVLSLHKPEKAHYSSKKTSEELESDNSKKVHFGKKGKFGGGHRKFGKKKFHKFNDTNNQQRSTQSCYSCGSQQHKSGHDSCPAKGKKCNGCSKIGHFKKVCRSSSSNSNSGGSNRFQSNSKNGFRRYKNFNNRRVIDQSDSHQNREESTSSFQSSEERYLAELLAKSVHL